MRFGFAVLVLIFASVPLDHPSADQADGAAAKLANGRMLFVNTGCGGCHTLADAQAAGQVGPSLDHDANLTPALVEDRVTNGAGPMPPFGDQLSKDEVAEVAAYVVQASAK